ncbi:MAG: sigma 54-interacting transcriptional regulator [Deltaproteobacteria bacterium]|nr:sigma 54-interacting transcriptional regulator [Deltaproteobacteria bacterium]
MAFDKNAYFRQATMLLCSHLEIEEAMKECLGYLAEFMPVDTMYLELYEPDFGAIRTIATATVEKCEKINRLTRLPQHARDFMMEMWGLIRQGENFPTVIVNDPETDAVSLAMVEDFETQNTSLLVLALAIQGTFLANVVIDCHGKNRYTAEHSTLLTLLAEPLAIAVSNHLKHQEVLTLKNKLLDDNRYLHDEMKQRIGNDIVGENFGLKHVMNMVRQVARQDSVVLLLGETGVGKDIIANAIQNLSPRREKPFVTVNCGAIPESLLDSELFGHEKGAFTGALSQKRGRFERADGGTIFLDEIGELPPNAQVRLLRVLQNRVIERVGGTQTIPVDIRIIAATNRDLEEKTRRNEFREDLWFRLNVFPISIPPLRERKKDIPALVHHFIDRKAHMIGGSQHPVLASGAIDSLINYHWPGNVRELENIIERSLILSQGNPLRFEGAINPPAGFSIDESPAHERPFVELDDTIKQHINKALILTKGKIHGVGGAAELLGINANTLRSRMKKLGIKLPGKVHPSDRPAELYED